MSDPVFFPDELHKIVGSYRERVKRLNMEYFALVRDAAFDPGAAVMLGMPEQTMRLIGAADRMAFSRVVGRGLPLIAPRTTHTSFWEKALSSSEEEVAILLAQEIMRESNDRR